MSASPLLSTLRERAGLQPDDLVFTYTDYDVEWHGVTHSVTWSQLYRRVQNLAVQVRDLGQTGDRAVILAPQGLEYIVAFLGSMLAGFTAVPLPLPFPGAHDERGSAVLADTQPAMVLTTARNTDTVAEYLNASNGSPETIAVDSLDLDARGVAGKFNPLPSTAYLQYTSGSTRVPAGVMISHSNIDANFRQLMADYFPLTNGVTPPGTTVVSWLPFYHDMGLMFAVVTPILGGFPSHLTSPVAFLQRPARWVQALARNTASWSAGPNFAFDLVAAKTSDEDMAGLSMADVRGVLSGAERVYPKTLRHFTERFAKFGLREEVLRPSYGLAEGTVYVACRTVVGPPNVVRFDNPALSDGDAVVVEAPNGTPLISYGMPRSPLVRIVDPETCLECPADRVGEIWVNGPNVAEGYWHKPEETAQTFGGVLANPPADVPAQNWLRTGDLGFVTDGEVFIVGRIKDTLIVYGKNHYPEDIEGTVSDITRGRVAAISVTADETEKLVVIIEYKKPRGADDDAAATAMTELKNQLTTAISKAHGLTAADLVLVGPGSLPTTTSGKIRRAACGDLYRGGQFSRLDT